MSRPTRWVIGRGLLGAGIERAGTGTAFSSAVDWTNPDGAVRDLHAGLRRFADHVEGDWEIYWSAGRGVTSTPQPQMSLEGDVFAAFLEHLVREGALDHGRGAVFLASSVGGAYAGSGNPPFNETTPPRPLSAYGSVKLRMEHALADAVDEAGLRGFIARITNIYGPGQNLGKGQGLISVIVDGYVTGRPVSIYVSLDTLRDYIFVDDCARVIDAAMARTRLQPAGTTITKIVGAMNALSIGAILGEMSRLRRKPVPLVLGQGDAQGQASDLRVRSHVWTDLDGLVSTTLPEGLGAVYRSQLAAHMHAG